LGGRAQVGHPILPSRRTFKEGGEKGCSDCPTKRERRARPMGEKAFLMGNRGFVRMGLDEARD